MKRRPGRLVLELQWLLRYCAVRNESGSILGSPPSMALGVDARMRLVIGGVPRAGKTTMSAAQRGIVLHTDDLIGRLDWSAVSEEVSRWFDRPYDVIEGVAAIRALRKWIDRHPTGKPCDRLAWLTRPLVPLTSGQRTMAQGCQTVFTGIAGALRARGVVIDVQ